LIIGGVLRQGQERHPLLLTDKFLQAYKKRNVLLKKNRASSKDTVDGPVVAVKNETATSRPKNN